MEPAWRINPKIEKYDTSLYMKLAMTKFLHLLHGHFDIIDMSYTSDHEYFTLTGEDGQLYVFYHYV